MLVCNRSHACLLWLIRSMELAAVIFLAVHAFLCMEIFCKLNCVSGSWLFFCEN